MPTLPEGPFRRRTARVLLMNDADRLLLFKFEGRSGPVWLTPGGGIDDGEPLHVAAARELREETGLVVAPEELGGLVAATGGYADLGWAKGIFREDYFFHRIESHDIDTSGFTPYEQKSILEHRWWSVAEIAATDERIVPWGLVPLLTGLLADGRPEDVVVLPWHH